MMPVEEKAGKFAWLTPLMESMGECPLCAGRGCWDLKYRVHALQVQECRTCGMMFLDPYLSAEGMKKIFSSPEYLTKISAFFADYGKEASWNTPKTQSFHGRVIEELERLSSRKGSLIDIGCGQGAFLKIAAKKGWKAAGLEPNCPNRLDLEKEFGIRILDSDFFIDPLPEEKFDAVSLWDLIEHVPDPKRILGKCRALLKEKGLLVIATPNHFSLLDTLGHWSYQLSRGNFLTAVEKLYTVDHTLYFSKDSLCRMLRREKYEILSILKVNTDLERYAMSPAFRFFSECLLAAGTLSNFQNRVLVIARPLV